MSAHDDVDLLAVRAAGPREVYCDTVAVADAWPEIRRVEIFGLLGLPHLGTEPRREMK